MAVIATRAGDLAIDDLSVDDFTVAPVSETTYRRIVWHGVRSIVLVNAVIAAWAASMFFVSSQRVGLFALGFAAVVAFLDMSWRTPTTIEVTPGYGVEVCCFLSSEVIAGDELELRPAGRGFALVRSARPKRALVHLRDADIVALNSQFDAEGIRFAD